MDNNLLKDKIAEDAKEIDNTKTKWSKKFKGVIIGECVVLAIALFVCRAWVFPFLAIGGMKHMTVSAHVFSIGLMATIFSFFAIIFKRVWKTHKRYTLIPIIFTVFGFLMQMLATEVSF